MKKLLAFLLFSCYIGSLSAQLDTVAPVLLCKPYLNTPSSQNCGAELYASDLIDTVFDNSGETVLLGIRRLCTGVGFPENQFSIWMTTYNYNTPLTIWAKDAAGNTSSCQTKVTIYDPGNCDFIYFVETKTDDLSNLPAVKISIEGWNCLGDTTRKEGVTDALGRFMRYGFVLPSIGYYGTVTPSKKTNHINGVTTYDLVLIQKHILGITPITSPYKLIAADANMDGAITTTDVVLLRKLILGIIPELPHGQSWRFVKQEYQFPNPANPFSPAFPEKYTVYPEDTSIPGQFRFIGVKIGDVNNTAVSNN